MNNNYHYWQEIVIIKPHSEFYFLNFCDLPNRGPPNQKSAKLVKKISTVLMVKLQLSAGFKGI